jgi:hypothetical protein
LPHLPPTAVPIKSRNAYVQRGGTPTDPAVYRLAAKETAFHAALSRIRLCESAAEILDLVAERLRVALARLRQVPEDLGEVYQLVNEFICKGGKLPVYAR